MPEYSSTGTGWGEKEVCEEGVSQFLGVWVLFCGRNLLGLRSVALNDSGFEASGKILIEWYLSQF